MSPTSLANHRLSVTSKSRALLPNAPLHRRLVRTLASYPPRRRRVALLLAVILFWLLIKRFSSSVTRSIKGSSSGNPTRASGAPSTPVVLDPLLRFVPSQLQRNKIVLRFKAGGESQVIVVPPPAIPRYEPPLPSGQWYESAWIDRGEVSRIEVPLGTRLVFQDSKGKNRTIENGAGDDCLYGTCKDLKQFAIQQDVLLALKQLGRSDPSKRIIVTLPSIALSRLEDITLVTQFSVSRLERFARTLLIWDGPVSLTIYLTESIDNSILSNCLSTLSPELREAWSRVALTLVKPSYSSSREALITRLRYPINELRNHALRLAPTHYLLVIDADFIPSPAMHQILRSRVPSLMAHPTRSIGSPTQSRVALVVSAFALSSSTHDFPSNLTTLKLMLDSKPPQAFLTDPNGGHGPSLPSLLFHTSPFPTHPSQTLVRPAIEWTYSICYEPQWEPYYVVHRSSSLLYDERFTDQGGDKQSHAAVMNALGSEWKVMRDVWVTHPPKDDRLGGIDQWPAGRLQALLAGEKGGDEVGREGGVGEDAGRHFNKGAQEDQQRYRYFQDFLPEVEKKFGANWRWPRGCEAGEAVHGRRVGRAASRTLFGL